jgi:hypothetical protein
MTYGSVAVEDERKDVLIQTWTISGTSSDDSEQVM